MESNFSEFKITRQKLTGLVAEEHLMLNCCVLTVLDGYCGEARFDSVPSDLQFPPRITKMTSSRVAYPPGTDNIYPLGIDSFPAVFVPLSLLFLNKHLYSPWF